MASISQTQTVRFPLPDGGTVDLDYDVTYTPAYVPQPTMFGDNPDGGSSAAGVAAIDAQFGIGAAIRLFSSTTPVAPAVQDRYTIGSFTAMPKTIDVGLLNSWGEIADDHEIDRKVIQGTSDLATWQAEMQMLLKAGVTNLVIIVTADCFVNPKKDPTKFLVDGVSRWAIDCDGVPPNESTKTYHQYLKEITAAAAFRDKYNLTMGAAEVNTYRGSWDPSGTQRVGWLNTTMGQIREAGFTYGCVWGQAAKVGSTWTTPAEVGAVSAMMATSPRKVTR